MHARDHRGVTLERCEDCGALWFDLSEWDAVLPRGRAGADLPLRTDAASERRHCPECVGAVDSGRCLGVAAWKCRQCGGMQFQRDAIETLVRRVRGEKPKEGSLGGADGWLLELLWWAEQALDVAASFDD